MMLAFNSVFKLDVGRDGKGALSVAAYFPAAVLGSGGGRGAKLS